MKKIFLFLELRGPCKNYKLTTMTAFKLYLVLHVLKLVQSSHNSASFAYRRMAYHIPTHTPPNIRKAKMPRPKPKHSPIFFPAAFVGKSLDSNLKKIVQTALRAPVFSFAHLTFVRFLLIFKWKFSGRFLVLLTTNFLNLK